MKLTKIISTIFIVVISVILLAFFVKGNTGNPLYYQYEKDTRVGGPFEASNSTARYALTEAMVLDDTFFLNPTLARFSAPDVSEFKGKYMSLFTPGVSFVAVPFYIFGTVFKAPQLFSYFSVSFFALINLILIAKLARKLGAGFYASYLSGFIFLFATNGLIYSQTLTQHHISVTFILLCFLNALEERTILRDLLFGFYFAASLLMDIPNPIILAPVLIYVLVKHFKSHKVFSKITLPVKLSIVGIAIGAIPVMALFGFYNYRTTGSFFTLAQNIGRAKSLSANLPVYLSPDNPTSRVEYHTSAKFSLPFNSRREIEGFYILLFSDERSWLFYSPVVLLGIVGIVSLYRKKSTRTISILLISTIVMNILLYSMFGDPWGGWAFGPRYLIPAASLMCVALGVFISRYKKDLPYMILFFTLLLYSLDVNALGAVTASVVPPKVEAVNLSEPIPYTYKYNVALMRQGRSSSLVYNLYFSKNLSLETYLYLLIIFGGVSCLILYTLSIFMDPERRKNA